MFAALFLGLALRASLLSVVVVMDGCWVIEAFDGSSLGCRMVLCWLHNGLWVGSRLALVFVEGCFVASVAETLCSPSDEWLWKVLVMVSAWLYLCYGVRCVFGAFCWFSNPYAGFGPAVFAASSMVASRVVIYGCQLGR
ncbi:hypothetical protein U1Q18_049071 [Sarracenia purpurea var. burkii]